ncbi:MAG: TAXI family TRAP transporter solute-binding subunit [Leptospiraceae bacterium]|nr:TAXI family TRAP transporter solute-binding subunit [Leptospiraceae bacterium]MCP5511181.1 TAXI family TRAP transporter solute-binding subunit [Leptospiraceae bacterium]
MKIILSLLILSTTLLSCKHHLEFRFAGGFTGGTYEKIAESLNAISDFKVSIQTTEGSLDNISRLKNGTAEFSITQLDVLQNHSIGDSTTFDSIKVLFPVYGEEIHVIAHKSIQSIEDLKGKKISIGESSSGTKLTSLLFLGYFGISNETSQLEEISYADSIPMLLDGTLQGMVLIAGRPVKLLTDLDPRSASELRLLSFTEDNLKSLKKTNLIYQRTEIPASTYSWEVSPIQTFLVQSVMITRSNIDPKIIRIFMKSIWQNRDLLATQHKKWQGITSENLKLHFEKYRTYYHPEVESLLKELK